MQEGSKSILKNCFKHTLCFFLYIFILLICLTCKNVSAFHGPLEGPFLKPPADKQQSAVRNSESSTYPFPFSLEQGQEILEALSGEGTPSEANSLTDPMPQIRTLARRLKAILFEAGPVDTRKRAFSGGIFKKRKDGTALFIKEGDAEIRERTSQEEEKDPAVVKEGAMAWLRSHADMLGLDDPLDEFECRSVWQDGLKMWHIAYKQVFKGIDVFGGEVVLHCDRYGAPFCLSGRYHPTPDILLPDGEKTISPLYALEKARQAIPGSPDADSEERLVCYFDNQGRSHLAWCIHLLKDPALNMDVFVSAWTGRVIETIDRVYGLGGPALGTGEDISGQIRPLNTYNVGSTYYLIDTSKDMFNIQTSILPYYVDGGILCFDLKNQDLEELSEGAKIYFYTSQDNTWDDPHAVSAMYNASLAYDYFNNTFGLKSFDNDGRNIYLLTHFGTDYNNAGWNGHFVILGDGDGETLECIPFGLDIIAHELGHAVVDYKANFIYLGQSGALHEAYADLFGVMTDRDDWLIGEDIVISDLAVRDMADPSRADLVESLPKHMRDYEVLPLTQDFDYGGVHRNVGIINRATYLIGNALGRSKTEQIYYRALDVYLTRYSQFVDLKLGLQQSALDLYGEYARQMVEDAFLEVGVTSSDPTPMPESPSVKLGEERILYVNPIDRSLWLISPDGQNRNPVTFTPVESRPAVTRNGKVVFIDQANNIRGINIDGTDERVLSNAGIWKSIAISQNLECFAVTIVPNQEDLINSQKIFLAYLDDQEADVREIKLEPPITTQDGEGRVGYIFPGGMDFDYEGDNIIFDAYHVLEWDTEHSIEYWDINMLHVTDEVVERPLPATGLEMDIGNPAFAQGSSSIFAYDLYLKESGRYRSLITNTMSGEDILLREGPGMIGSCPSFSPDNRHIVYHYLDADIFYLRIVDIDKDFGALSEGSDRYLESVGRKVIGILPKWFYYEPSADQDGGPDISPDPFDSGGAIEGLFQTDEGGCFIDSLK